MTAPTTLTGMLQLFRNSDEVTRGRLRMFSNLRERDYPTFWGDWTKLPLGSRLRMITLMNEISEEHVDYDFKPVLRWALADADADVRQRAIDGLAEEDNPRVIAPLLHILTNDPQPATRSAAALALARFCEYAALEELAPTHVAPLVDGLTAALASNNDTPEVYRRIIEALGWVADANIDALIEDTWHHSDIPMRESALVAMGRSMSERWYPTVKQALDHGHPAIRYEAARAAGLYGDDALTCIPQLINLAQEDDIEVATSAIWALGQIDDHRAIKALEKFSTSRDQVKRDAALDALGNEGGADDLLGNWRNAFRSTDDDDDDDEE